MIPLERLKSLKIFADIAPASLTLLGQDMVEKTYGPGTVILKEGEESGSLYLIAAGSVSVEKKLGDEGARSKIVARLEAEEFFGEMSFLENASHSATIVAQEETHIFLLPRSAVEDLIKKDPGSALDQVMTLMSGVSSRLRRTTRELVTVFEVARMMGQPTQVDELMKQVVAHLLATFGEKTSVAFYRWNPFNDEYSAISVQGAHRSLFPAVLELKAPLLADLKEGQESLPDLTGVSRVLSPLNVTLGHLVISRSDMQNNREGLFLYYAPQPRSFDAGERQMMETISAVIAPALSTARSREEDLARSRLERSKQDRTYL
ncbi:MAG: cyclic nucleotide-binding domain-containing protein [Elusimicrobia bacterium]|nr:cyclic nucleotide-binding domain-containing protein [Candidatus Obscuribacterium magneticum]